jgi:hypothetical protein
MRRSTWPFCHNEKALFKWRCNYKIQRRLSRTGATIFLRIEYHRAHRVIPALGALLAHVVGTNLALKVKGSKGTPQNAGLFDASLGVFRELSRNLELR